MQSTFSVFRSYNHGPDNEVGELTSCKQSFGYFDHIRPSNGAQSLFNQYVLNYKFSLTYSKIAGFSTNNCQLKLYTGYVHAHCNHKAVGRGMNNTCKYLKRNL